MKTVYENGSFEYTTLKTEGSFEDLKIEYEKYGLSLKKPVKK